MMTFHLVVTERMCWTLNPIRHFFILYCTIHICNSYNYYVHTIRTHHLSFGITGLIVKYTNWDDGEPVDFKNASVFRKISAR